MERLIFLCPISGAAVDVGITTEIRTLLRIRSKVLRGRCSACGQWHEWPIRDAFLAEAA